MAVLPIKRTNTSITKICLPPPPPPPVCIVKLIKLIFKEIREKSCGKSFEINR